MPAPRKRPSREADITIDDTGDEEILNAIAGINNIPTKSAKTTPVILSTTPTTTPQPKKRRTTTPDHSPPKLRFNSRTAASLLPRRSAPRAARYPPPSAADHSVYNNHSLFLDTSTVEPTPRVQPPPPPARSVRPPPTPTPIASASMYDLAKVDWTLCDPLARESNLFKFDYLLYGNPTYKQADSNNRFYPRGRRDLAPPEPKAREPSWARTADLRSLANNMNTHEEFFATCWVRDVIGDDAEELEVVGPWGEAVEMKVVEDSKKGIRKTEVSGIDMMLMGKEFPCRNVLLVGIVVEVDVSEEKGIISYRSSSLFIPLPTPQTLTVHHRSRRLNRHHSLRLSSSKTRFQDRSRSSKARKHPHDSRQDPTDSQESRHAREDATRSARPSGGKGHRWSFPGSRFHPQCREDWCVLVPCGPSERY